MNMKTCLFTNDVETTSIWHNSLRDETGLKVLKEGMPIILELYKKYGIKSTFFFTGYIANKYPDIVKMILPYGHEVGSHGMSHLKKNGFDIMPLNKQIDHLNKSKLILEDISGIEVISFRAPALRTNKDTAIALAETGYKIDSSVASQRFDLFMSFGAINKLNWLTAPRLPYRTDSNNLFRKGNGSIVEVPLSATILPYLGTTMRISPFITKLQHHILNLENKLNSKPIVFDIHPNEFIDESNEARLIESRCKNYLEYLIRDVIRSKIKVRNMGQRGVALYERELLFYKNRDYHFLTIKDFVSRCFK